MRRGNYFANAFALLLALALLVAFGSGWVLWQTQQDQTIESLRAGRFRFGLNRVRNALESGLNLGIPATELPGAQALIDQVRAEEQDILSIDVFDAQGRVLLSTDISGVRERVPTQWLTPCLGQTAKSESLVDRDAVLQCGPLLNAYDRVVGGVLLRHRPFAERADRAEGPAWGDALVGVGLAGLALLLLAWAWMRAAAASTERALHAATQRLVPLPATREADVSVVTESETASELPPLVPALTAIHGFADTLQRTSAELDEIDAWEPRA